MTTKSNNLSSSSLGFSASQKCSSSETCTICKKCLYTFEEILYCRVCQNPYHWRCAKPETITHYGEKKSFLCDQCTSNSTTSTLVYRSTNDPVKLIKSNNLSENDLYQDYSSVASPKVSSNSNVVTKVQYSEERQQPLQTYRTTKSSEFNDVLTPSSNDREYSARYGQRLDDKQTNWRPQQQEEHQHFSDIEVNEDNNHDTSAMFQANYQYTPLKDYAASNNDLRVTDEMPADVYRNSPPNRLSKSRYANGLQYNNHGYDPTISRLIEVLPVDSPMPFSSPTVDNMSRHNSQQHFVSTTSLNLAEKSAQRFQQTERNEIKPPHSSSSPYLAVTRTHESPKLKPSSQQQQSDRHSAVGSDSGIVMVNSNNQSTPDENQFVEKKLADLVQQLGKQLETDAQKINEKLESKLKNLEQMIHQQTYIIRRQDEVIERLKTKIFKIEGERDHFRERLSYHEQEKQSQTDNKHLEQTSPHPSRPQTNQQANDTPAVREYSNASTTISNNNKIPTKKAPAPRIDHQLPNGNTDDPPGITQLIKTVPLNQERFESGSSSSPSAIRKLVSAVPLVETPAATNRLHEIIHQQNHEQLHERISINDVLTVIHQQDTNDSAQSTFKENRSRSESPSTSSSSSARLSIQPINITTVNINSDSNKTTSRRRSIDFVPPYTQDTDSTLINKASSLNFGTKSMENDDTGSIYITPVEANQPANESYSIVKGWLRKQNRSSILKRIEQYYCVLTNQTLLMHRRAQDRMPHKAINLQGAKVLFYADTKHGPALELTWTRPAKSPKHYHFYAANTKEAQQWAAGIEAVIVNLRNNSQWQRYRPNT